MPCGCRKGSQGGDNVRTKKPTCACQTLAANIASCCKGGKQKPSSTPKEASCYCKPAPPKQLETPKSCKCDETARDAELDQLMEDQQNAADKSKENEKDKDKDKEAGGKDEEGKDKETAKKKGSKDNGGKSGAKSTKFSIRLSPEQLAATCMCGEQCNCVVCTCKPDTLWKCTDPEETEDCCVQLEGESTCKKRGKEPAPLKYYLKLTPEQLAQTCDCEEECECELCTCKLKLKSCKILCLRRFKGKKTCPCVCFKSLNADESGGEGGGGGKPSGLADTGDEKSEKSDKDDDEDDGLGDAQTSALPQVSCKCKYIKQAAAKVQEKKKPCGPPQPPRCCPKPY